MQFAASSFNQFLHRWGVKWAPSTPHFPSSNGHSECFVKQVKNLLAKLPKPDIQSEEFQEALLELRNTPRQGGRSPNMIVFGRNLRSRVPTHYEAFDEKWQVAAKEADERNAIRQEKIQEHYNRSARDLKPFKVGDHVRIQDHATKRWDRLGEIVGVGKHRDYRIKMPSGRTWWRNRRFLRKFNGDIEESSGDEPEMRGKEGDEKEEKQLRRSPRNKNKK